MSARRLGSGEDFDSDGGTSGGGREDDHSSGGTSGDGSVVPEDIGVGA